MKEFDPTYHIIDQYDDILFDVILENSTSELFTESPFTKFLGSPAAMINYNFKEGRYDAHNVFL